MHALDTVELVDLAKLGNAPAFGTLIERYRASLYTAALHRLNQPADAVSDDAANIA